MSGIGPIVAEFVTMAMDEAGAGARAIDLLHIMSLRGN